ncbi:hypothetical protein MXT65_17710 [Clostridioides difficile]|uniref:DUF6751 family protein n=1 Tax=Clostridioides difficile TaxID=1496 RepID=UPI000C9CB27F|nr:DUF6751 family protein [Clostridioides difficile]MBY1363312.1 hypothetical protein [Clostridioides difficile]MBY1861705.1 hypothetical protein [Clostridioides difficile]MBZ0925348.1 hypothetical protein [Clostridioides difficile]MCH7327599.1 hypothetical protein [Clostridioides difficile]MCJ1757349.1 hypothetical protein [Clostridioides difficile]
MFFKDNITLYNACYNKELEANEYFKTYLIGVDWQGQQNINVTDKGIISADSIKIIIPFLVSSEGKKYIEPKEFEKLDITEKGKYFTFNNNDKIVKGLIDFDIDSKNGKTIKILENLYSDVININSIITHDFGSLSMRSWEIGGI